MCCDSYGVNDCTFLQTDPVEYVENMCENMQLYPRQDFLTGDQLLFEYKPEVRSTPFKTALGGGSALNPRTGEAEAGGSLRV